MSLKGVFSMKSRNWSTRILWFILGAVIAGSLLMIRTPQAQLNQSNLEQRVTALEKEVKAIYKALDQEYKERTKKDPMDRYK